MHLDQVRLAHEADLLVEAFGCSLHHDVVAGGASAVALSLLRRLLSRL